ncbi:glycosyl phosphatidyl inositol with 16 signal peptide and transmembrane domain or GPI anchor [Cryptosporidium ryanae]|uniref:glycosyl phosphatidyl inositol with 16 signal peptide and transmembrane domain or GPI anchor n=1 Tax=Cryptosporidium ryanae TaxID=515981 RepID=UPI00351A5BA5|nr:glycosyl phosphatidyl inositol with 16 signal peptide and transmembrane domain or GPI anchor [Cryptosporidium ryanae]
MVSILRQIILVIVLFINDKLCLSLLSEQENSVRTGKIIEKNVIHRLPHKNRYLFRYNIDMEIDTYEKGNNYKNVNFIPKEFSDISKLDVFEDLFVISVQGTWRDENWGEPPIDIYPAGLTLNFRYKYPDKHSVITVGIWNYILNTISNILCSSFDVFKNELYTEKNCIDVNINNDTKNVICTNHDNTLCIDTLTCWKRMFPCFSFGFSKNIDQNGILGKLPLNSFITSSYKSIGFRMRRVGNSQNEGSSLADGKSKTVFTLFLETVLKGEDRILASSVSNTNSNEDFNLWSFHKLESSSEAPKPCPAIEDSRLYFFVENYNYFSNETQSDDTNLLCRHVNLNKHSLKRGEFNATKDNTNGLMYLELNISKMSNQNIVTSFDLSFFQKHCGISIFKDISSLTYTPISSNYIENYNKHGNSSKRFFSSKKYEYTNELDVRRSYTNSISELGEINSIWTQGSLVVYMRNNVKNQVFYRNVTLCHWEKIPKFINIWFHKTKVLYSNKKEITDIYEDSKSKDVVVLYSNKATKFIGLGITNSNKNTVMNFCTELSPKMNLAVIFYFDKLFLPLNYYGAKSQRGQISPPSVTHWSENNDNSQIHTTFHRIYIIPTILVDHTMVFNVIATTSAFIVFGFITTIKFIQLNEKNVA